MGSAETSIRSTAFWQYWFLHNVIKHLDVSGVKLTAKQVFIL